MKYKAGDRVKYINLIGKIREILVEKRQISIWVEFPDNKMAIFNHEGFLTASDKDHGDKYKLKKE